MLHKFKHNVFGYFSFFYSILGNKLIFNLLLGIAVSFLDGLGLAMFIPLIQFVNNSSSVSVDSMGHLRYIIELYSIFGLPLNIYSVLITMVLLFMIKGVLTFWQLNAQVNLRQLFMRAIRFQQTDDLKNISYQGFLLSDAGRIQNTYTTEINRIIQMLIHFLATSKFMMMLLTYVVLAFLANWQFALFVAIGATVSNFAFKNIIGAIKRMSQSVSRYGHVFNALLIQSVHSFKYLKATGSFEVFETKLKDVIRKSEDANRKIGKNQSLTASIKEPIVIFIVVIVMIIQLRFLKSDLGSMILTVLLFYRALSFLMNIQTSWQIFMQNVGALSSISELSFQMQSMKEVLSNKIISNFDSAVSVSNLNFRFEDNLILNDINLTIPKNRTIAFVGESGSGKSTLANVIAGLLEPAEGQVLIDGANIRDYNLNEYRSMIGYISQDPAIFNDTVYNNVTFWSEKNEKNLRRFEKVIEQTSLTSFLNELPNKEDTLLGDNGMLISGGQKQRVSIARELFKDSSILILDEATSALDSETEQFIQNNIEQLQGLYTIIIIAHRLSTIRNADSIYLLEKGKIHHSGSFETMMSVSPKFRRMVSLQEF